MEWLAVMELANIVVKGANVELLSDSEARQLRAIREWATELAGEDQIAQDVRFLLRYIGELENERWSYYHG